MNGKVPRASNVVYGTTIMMARFDTILCPRKKFNLDFSCICILVPGHCHRSAEVRGGKTDAYFHVLNRRPSVRQEGPMRSIKVRFTSRSDIHIIQNYIKERNDHARSWLGCKKSSLQ